MYSPSKKRIWAKRLVLFCFGFAIGSLGINAWDGKWRNACEWGVAAFFALAWRVEMGKADEDRADADYWKNLWLNSESTKSYSKAFSNPIPELDVLKEDREDEEKPVA